MIRTGAAALLLLLVGSARTRPWPRRSRATSPSAIARSSSGCRAVRRGRSRPAGASLIKWRESRGPNCIAATRLIGATLLSQNSVDLILRDNSQVRARLQRTCPSLDYYRGFYINATADGRICADRDSCIRSRAGGECRIDQFRALSPDRP